MKTRSVPGKGYMVTSSVRTLIVADVKTKTYVAKIKERLAKSSSLSFIYNLWRREASIYLVPLRAGPAYFDQKVNFRLCKIHIC